MTSTAALPESYWRAERSHAAEADSRRSRTAALDAITGRTFRAIRDRAVRTDVAAHIMVRSLHRQAQRLGIEGVRYIDLHRGLSGHDGLALEDLPTREDVLF